MRALLRRSKTDKLRDAQNTLGEKEREYVRRYYEAGHPGKMGGRSTGLIGWQCKPASLKHRQQIDQCLPACLPAGSNEYWIRVDHAHMKTVQALWRSTVEELELLQHKPDEFIERYGRSYGF